MKGVRGGGGRRGRLRPAGRARRRHGRQPPSGGATGRSAGAAQLPLTLTSKLGVRHPALWNSLNLGQPAPRRVSTLSPLGRRGCCARAWKCMFGERVGECCHLRLACGPMQGIPGLRPPAGQPVDPLLGR